MLKHNKKITMRCYFFCQVGGNWLEILKLTFIKKFIFKDFLVNLVSHAALLGNNVLFRYPSNKGQKGKPFK